MKIELDEFCPCCGYNTFDKTDRLHFDICPICFWEDDAVQFSNPTYEGGANYVSLIQAQQNFEKFGACEKEMIIHVRKPAQTDIRKAGWTNV